MDLKIRKYINEDYDLLIELWKISSLPYRPKGRDSREELVRQNKLDCSLFLVAEAEGRLIGSLFGSHDGRKGWINRLAVHPDFQRKNIGTKLVEEVEKLLEKAEIGIFACLIEAENEISKKVFQRLGYKVFKGISYCTKRSYEDV